MRASILVGVVASLAVVIAGCGGSGGPGGADSGEDTSSSQHHDTGTSNEGGGTGQDSGHDATNPKEGGGSTPDATPDHVTPTESGGGMDAAHDSPSGQETGLTPDAAHDTGSDAVVPHDGGGGDAGPFSSDPSNCGKAGNVCPTVSNGTATCTNGVCSATCVAGYASNPAVTTTNCSIDIETDPANCGKVANACPAIMNGTATCVGGVCGATCAAGYAPAANEGPNCNVDLGTDPDNCGAPGAVCPAVSNGTSTCTNGMCTVTCAMGYASTPGSTTPNCSIDLSTDPDNCGKIAMTCATGATCQNGMCVCPGTEVVCNGVCVNEQSDPNDCGGCGKVCPVAMPVCSAGICTIICAPGTTACTPNTCDNLTNDPKNCGMCGFVCPAGASCVNSMCDCPTGDIVCNDTCVNDQTNPNDCGGCGKVCPTGANCVAGNCACPTGDVLCNGVCVNEMNDPNNCDGCGKVCANGTTCQGGACACPPGDVLCNGVCTNQNNDPNNCGGCGVTCIDACDNGLCNHETAFTYTGTTQIIQLPANVVKFQVKLWGASGADGAGAVSGSGGFVSNNEFYVVTPGETLTVIVGGGGVSNKGVAAGGYGGGGEGGSNPAAAWGGSGGGRSAILLGTQELIVAGGGGGTGSPGMTGNGGGGCGSVGTANGGNATGPGAGQGGTTSGGAGGTGTFAGGVGSKDQGGNSGATGTQGGAGGGGGGYFGGGAGGATGTTAAGTSGAGGGGACFGPASTIYSNTGGTTDPDFAGSAGVPVTNANGNAGRVVIRY